MRCRVAAGVGLLYVCVLFAGVAAQSSAIASFDFFYFVVQWPASYCDLSEACCYPTTGKPSANFSIHGLWPNYNDGSYPSNCDSSDPFDESEIPDLIPEMDQVWGSLSCPSSDSLDFWGHEWDKHGTCSGLGQHGYFDSALALIDNIDFLTPLRSAGIVPNGGTYSVAKVQNALSTALGGHTPGVECNTDTNGRHQLYQVYICVDTDATSLIDCPIFPSGHCQSTIHWPRF